MKPLIITLDGPAGSGKSTLARQLALRLGLEFLDTGAMYRGLTAILIREGIDPFTNAPDTIRIANATDVRFDWTQDPPRLLVNGEDLTGRIRDADVTRGASPTASIGAVRTVMVEAQRRIGIEHPRLVTEGRDQGSVVFPHANLKFYMDARADIRARRRAAQLREAGKPADEQEILKGIIERDTRDSQRKDGPLVCPGDALRIDTSELSPQQVLDLLVAQATTRVMDRLDPEILGRGAGSHA